MKKKLLENETTVEWFDIINYTVFGFLIGAFPTVAALSAMTLLKMISWFWLIRSMKKLGSIYYFIRKTLESLVHTGFLTLFIMQYAQIKELLLEF